MNYAEVAVNAPVAWPRTFTYSIPLGLSVSVGSAVWVPFGNRLLQGIVFGLPDHSPVEETKSIAEVIGNQPLLSPHRVELARWISEHYLCSLFDTAVLMLPPDFARRTLVIVDLSPGSHPEDLTPAQQKVYSFLAQNGRTPLSDLKDQVQCRGVASAVKQLIAQGVVKKSTELDKPRIKPKFVEHVRLRLDPQEARQKAGDISGTRRAPKQAELLKILSASPHPLPIREARLEAGCSDGVIRALIDEGLIEKVKSGKAVAVRLVPGKKFTPADFEGEKGARQIGRVLTTLSEAAEPPTLSDLRAQTGVSNDTLERMAQKGWLSIERTRITRDPLSHLSFRTASPPDLTPDQQKAWMPIYESLRGLPASKKVFLLHGITGSGKTEIYLRALDQAIAQGKRGIVLVPEIALTPQTIERFSSRFPGRVAVIHSRLSPGEEFDEWQRIRAGEFDVVIGSRSAVFAPQPDLGLIVIDEEHEWTYKQHEKIPLYHARDVALKLADLTGAVVVLGSATPDLASYHRAMRGDYELLELPRRVGELHKGAMPSLPQVEIVDLRHELKTGNRSIFSRKLARAINAALDLHEQVILFLNRRGTASFVQCRDCGYVMRCRRCEITLAYHGEQNKLLCHQCNRREDPPRTCPECGSERIKFLGIGTQKVEEEAAKAFPRARLLRWDRDVTGGRHSHEEILAKFQSHRADILIGTQMVAKGLDIPLVTLVGVVNADTSLYLPYFGAGERTYQLLSQVAGRAGRGRRPGQVIIQTYSPDHYAVVAAAQQDYRAFYEQEIELRRPYEHPPFSRLAILVYSNTSLKRCQEESQKMIDLLRQEKEAQGLSNASILGPVPCYVQKLRGRYRWQVIIRAPDPLDILSMITIPRGWTIDIDPVGLT